MKQRVEVVAALIWSEDKGEQKFMICQRGAQKTNGLLWEFVGGKVEAGESPEEALIRECKEELEITVAPKYLYSDTEYEYADIRVHLSLYLSEIEKGIPQLKEHRDLRWITPLEISQFKFCPADRKFLEQILYEDALVRIPCGRWRHFKGNLYEVMGIAKHSETLEPMVIYRALYGEGAIWARPVAMWLETVMRDGQAYQRFTCEGDASRDGDSKAPV